MRWSCITGFLLLFVFAPVFSGSLPASVVELQDRARELQLWESRSWQRLLHYRAGTKGSDINDPRFFLSSHGRMNAQSELLASIATLLAADSGPPATPGAAADAHPRCRFVERERWLREALELPAALPPAACAAYHEWRTGLQADAVTLIFPATYLNNPASMFGHTLLRIDPAGVEAGSSWLSWSLNFAADVGADTPQSMAYAWKGITGGYAGKFHLVPYFRKLQEYGAIENRDIWEYELSLEPLEVDRLTGHAWELRDIAFKYFFFRENCSYRLLELLDYARPTLDLTAGFGFTAIPGNTVKAVVEAGLVEKVRYRPSVASRLQHDSQQIPSAQRHWVRQLRNHPERAALAEFQMLPAALQRDIVLTANALLTFETRREAPGDAGAARRFRMLQQVSEYPAAQPSTVPRPPRPDRGHDTTLLGLAAGREAGLNHFEALLRLSYHDLLDRPAGYLAGASIVLGDLRLRRDEQKRTRLERFDILQIRSISSRVPLLDGFSWGVDAGFQRDPALQARKLSFRLQGLVGHSRLLAKQLVTYALAGPSVNVFARGEEKGYLNGHVRVGLINHTRVGSQQFDVDFDALQGQSLRSRASLTWNLPLSRNHALRAVLAATYLRRQHYTEGQLQYRFHF